MSTATGAPEQARADEAARELAGPGGRAGGWLAALGVTLLGVLAWAAALAAVEPLVRGYLTSPPDSGW